MRHWHWYTTTGAIGGEAVMDGGWNPAIDFNNPNEPDETAQLVRKLYVGLPGFAGFIAHDCACPSKHRWCDCARKRTDVKFIDLSDPQNPTAQNKVGFTIIIDDQVVAHGSMNDKSPGATVSVKLTGDVEDGAVVQLVEHPANVVHVMESSPVALTFVGGETNVATLTAPLKGFVARLALQPADRRHSSNRGFRIRGW